MIRKFKWCTGCPQKIGECLFISLLNIQTLPIFLGHTVYVFVVLSCEWQNWYCHNLAMLCLYFSWKFHSNPSQFCSWLNNSDVLDSTDLCFVWHGRISCGASWNPQVSEITEARGQSWLLHHRLEAAQ